MSKIISCFSLSFIILLLTSCSALNENSNTSNIETKLFETVLGDVEIPVNPQRIVTDYYLGEFLILDVKPIIASDYALNNPFLEGLVDGITPLATTNASNSLELIASAQPDLIVTLHAHDVEAYSAIAPTVLIPFGSFNDDELFLYIADMLGREDKAKEIIQEFNEMAISYKEYINEIVGDKTVSIMEVWPSELWVFGNNFARGGHILYDIWELDAPHLIEISLIDNDTLTKDISFERLHSYAGDIMIVGVTSDVDTTNSNSGFLKNTELWNSLEAVQENRVMEYNTFGFMHTDPISLRGQLELYVEFFTSLES